MAAPAPRVLLPRRCFCALFALVALPCFYPHRWHRLVPPGGAAAEDDTECLRTFKSSVVDVNNYLSNWTFDSGEVVLDLCRFVGVTCWVGYGNTVLSLALEHAGPSGRFPHGLSQCKSLQSLSLAHNRFAGPLPWDLCDQIPYLRMLDLSNNTFSGQIPSGLHNCNLLSSLHLQDNQLNGSIPSGIGTLPVLRDLNLSNNALSGPIPSSFTNRSTTIGGQSPFSACAFDGNPGLFGPPLSTAPCHTKLPKPNKVPKLFKLEIAGGSVLVFLLLFAITASGITHWRSACRRATATVPVMFDTYDNLLRVTWEDLRRATSDFSTSNIVGVGGSSTVYKAKLSPAKIVAVKVLEYSTFMDEGLQESDVCKQFLTELHVLGKLRHRNLVRILSYCHNVTSMVIVLEYMALGSLDALLHGEVPSHHVTQSKDLCPLIMNWQARLRILVNIAEGLEYLHQQYDGKCYVIHGDMKPGNVLLDEHMEAHIADFGLARLVGAVDTDSFAVTPSRQVVTGACWWSFGYTAPECMQQGVVSRKSDVFSFGVTALEVMTGERPSSCRLREDQGQSLAEWVGEALAQGAARTVVAPTLVREREWSQWGGDITAALGLACRCASKVPSGSRPDMNKVASCLRQLIESSVLRS